MFDVILQMRPGSENGLGSQCSFAKCILCGLVGSERGKPHFDLNVQDSLTRMWVSLSWFDDGVKSFPALIQIFS